MNGDGKPIDKSPKSEKRFNFDYYLNQQVRTDSDVTHKSVTSPYLYGVDEQMGSNFFEFNFYSGGGWRLWKNQRNRYNLMIDNLWVRGTMTIWELIINQLRASNGTLIIGSSAKTKEDGYEFVSGTTYNLWFDNESTDVDLQPFAVNDIIMAKRFKNPNDGSTPATLIECYGTVTAISVGGEHNKITVNFAGSPSEPGDIGADDVLEFVRIGNTTDASRQGLLVLTSDGIDSGISGATVPYLDVYSGLDSRAKFLDKDYVTARLGRLDEITANTDQFGLWTNTLILAGGSGNSGINGVYYGYGDPSGTAYNEGDTWIDLNERKIWRFESGGWVDTGAWQGVDGSFNMPDLTTQASGLYATSAYMGFWNGTSNAWHVYFDNAGNMRLGTATQAFKYTQSSNLVEIGASAGNRWRIYGSGTMGFWDTSLPGGAGYAFTLESDLFGDASNYGGIKLGRYGMVYSHITADKGVSAWHVEHKNQSNSADRGVITAHISTGTLDEPSNPGTSHVALKGTSRTDAGSASPIGVFGYATNGGLTDRTVYGGYFQATGIAGDTVYGLYAVGSGGTSYAAFLNGRTYVDTRLLVGTTSFNNGRIQLPAGITAADGIYWGNDVALYRKGVDILETNKGFHVLDYLNVTNNIVCDGNLVLATGESLSWNAGSTRFEFSDQLYLPADGLVVGNRLLSDDGSYMNINSSLKLQGTSLYFNNSTERLYWNVGTSRFFFTDDLDVDGHLYCNNIYAGSGTGDESIYFDGGVERLFWNDANNRFRFTKPLYLDVATDDIEFRDGEDSGGTLSNANGYLTVIAGGSTRYIQLYDTLS
jgi:hypothetical protein